MFAYGNRLRSNFSEKYLVHASLYGTSVPDLIRIHFLGRCGSLIVHAGGEMVTAEFLRHLPVQRLQDSLAVFVVQ